MAESSGELEFQNVPIISSTPKQRSIRQSSSPREPTFLASKSTRRNRSSSTVTPPAKRRKQFASSLTIGTSEIDILSERTFELSSESNDSQFVQISKGKKVKTVGKIYNLLCPKSKCSLYAQIIKNSSDLENMVDSWICMYQFSRNDAMSLLLNLFINLMGYQNVEIDYSDELDYIALRKYLEGHTNKTQEKLICLFRSRSSFAKTFIAAFFVFLQNLVFACDKANVLYESTFYNTLLSFVTEMCKSNNRVIIVTTCSVAINLVTNFLLVLKHSQNNMDSSESSNTSILTKHSDCLLSIIEELCNHILNFSTIQDVKLHILRMRSAEEFGVWFKMFPQFFMKEQIFYKLRRLIVDTMAYVRLAALKTCTVIVKKEKFQEFISVDPASFTKLYNTILARLNDNNVNVEITAVRFCTKSSIIYPEMLTVDIQRKIFDRMYAYDYKVARESGLFCIAVLFGTDRLQRMSNILKLDQLPQYKDHTEVLVHTLIGCIPELCDIEFIINLIYDENFSSSESVKLLKIIYHITHILVKGTLGYSRSQTSLDVDLNKMNEYVGSKIIRNIMDLFRYFNEDEESQAWILKSLVILDITPTIISTCREYISNMVKYLIEILKNSLNKTILSLTSEILGKLFAETYQYMIFSVYLDELITQHQKNVYLHRKQTIPRTDVVNMQNRIYVLSIISEYHNCVNILDWNDIYSNWGQDSSYNEIIKYQMICCRHYLKWEFKNLIEMNEEESAPTISLKQHIEDFLTSSANILKITRSENLSIPTYLAVCEFFIEYYKTGTDPKANELVETLDIRISNYSGLADSMESFVENHCFHSDYNSLFGRKLYLIKYITLIMIGVINTDKIILIMKHYTLFKEDYKSIYQLIFDKLNKVNNLQLSICIFKTLLTLFLENEKPKLLKTTSMDFVQIHLKSRHHLIIKMGIQYIALHKNNLKFILVLKPFLQNISKMIKLELLKYVILNCPEEYYRDPAFVLFLEAMKLKNELVSASEKSSTLRTRSNVSYVESSSSMETSSD